MIVRELGPADAGAFQALRLRGLRESPSAFASSYEEEVDVPLSTVADRLAARPDRCVLGALNGPDLLGVVGLRREGMRKMAHKALLWGMYVSPDARRAGIGRALVAAALDRAAAMAGVRQVYLGVNVRNVAALTLYESMGFTEFGREGGFMLLEGELHDEIHMVCRLPATDPDANALEPDTLARRSWPTRPVAAADRAEWLRMRLALWPSETDEHARDIDEFVAGRSPWLDAVFLCEDGAARTVGFIELRIRNYAEDSAHTRVAYVEGWYVDSGHRHQGVGAALMAQAEAWAKAQGFTELASDCELDNSTSIAAHTALGFTETVRLVCFLKQLSG
jgi:ribosomal protein S18 acetylase RimI-like enzyme